MDNNIISVGDKLDLIKTGINEQMKETSMQYKSKILDIVDDQHIKISMPMISGRIIPLEVGSKYNLWIYTQNTLYSCEGLIEGRYRNENLFVLEVTLLTKLKKLQRREYYRLSCFINVSYRIMTLEEEKYFDLIKQDDFEKEEDKNDSIKNLTAIQTEWKEAVITDISGGGTKINIDERLKEDERILLKLPLEISGEYEELGLKLRIMESYPLTNNVQIFEHRAKFIDLKKEEREALIRFIFEEERKIIRKEKGMN